MAGERILFVDDEDSIRKLVGTYLQRHGYTVGLAADGLQALQLVRDQVPDLVITDVNMPNIGGLELAQRLRSNHKTARVPIIMLSALKRPDDILAGYAEGADEYIPKPIELSILGVKVETLLRRSGAAQPVPGAASKRGRVTLFMHGKGGVGTTTLAVNTAVALTAGSATSVALLDLNLEFGNAALFMNVRPATCARPGRWPTCPSWAAAEWMTRPSRNSSAGTPTTCGWWSAATSRNGPSW